MLCQARPVRRMGAERAPDDVRQFQRPVAQPGRLVALFPSGYLGLCLPKTGNMPCHDLVFVGSHEPNQLVHRSRRARSVKV